MNKVHEWNFVNTEYETSHPIHMHVNHMQVVSYNEYTGPVGVGNDDGEWKLFDRSGQTCTYQHQAYHGFELFKYTFILYLFLFIVIFQAKVRNYSIKL